MSAPAAFRAAYSDFKLVKTRSVAQFIFEVPIENVDAAYKVLGGMPKPGSEIWCAVARLNPESEVMPPEGPPLAGDQTRKVPETRPAAAPSLQRAERRPKPLAQAAALMCHEPIFFAWVREVHAEDCTSEDEAANFIRRRCGVASRAEIRHDTPAGDRFNQMRDRYLAWRMVAA